MTLDEAIKHCEEQAEELRIKAEFAEEAGNYRKEDCLECAKEQEQLVKWLEELKAYRELFESPQEAKRTLEQLMV